MTSIPSDPMVGFLINSIINRGKCSLHLDGVSYIGIRNRNKNRGSTGENLILM